MSKRRGNPAVSLTLPDNELRLVDAYATARGLTRSKALHELVRWGLGANHRRQSAIVDNLKTDSQMPAIRRVLDLQKVVIFNVSD